MNIAQITDLHIKAPGKLAYRKVDIAANLAQCVAHLNRLVPQPDLVVATGDLVDSGAPDEYEHLRQLLRPLRAPVYLLPGNHDDRQALRAAFPDCGYLREGGEFIHYVIDGYPVRLVALDTVVPGEPGGELCAARLAWLDARLGEAPDRPTAIFMHHPPFLTGITHMDVQNCRGGDMLGALVEKHRQVRWLMCGHVHRAIQVHWHGIVGSIAPSASHHVAFDLRANGPSRFVLEPPAYHLHHWRPDTGLITHTCFTGAFDGPYPFFENGKLIA